MCLWTSLELIKLYNYKKKSTSLVGNIPSTGSLKRHTEQHVVRQNKHKLLDDCKPNTTPSWRCLNKLTGREPTGSSKILIKGVEIGFNNNSNMRSRKL